VVPARPDGYPPVGHPAPPAARMDPAAIDPDVAGAVPAPVSGCPHVAGAWRRNGDDPRWRRCNLHVDHDGSAARGRPECGAGRDRRYDQAITQVQVGFLPLNFGPPDQAATAIPASTPAGVPALTSAPPPHGATGAPGRRALAIDDQHVDPERPVRAEHDRLLDVAGARRAGDHVDRARHLSSFAPYQVEGVLHAVDDATGW